MTTITTADSMIRRGRPVIDSPTAARKRWSLRRVANAAPTKMPYMKKVEGTYCGHGHGMRSSRVTMSKMTEVQKPASVTPHSTINVDSSQSSDFHLSCRWRCRTSERSLVSIRYPDRRGGLLDGADLLLDLGGLRAEFLGHLF